MKKTDYQRVSAHYDENQARLQIPPDADVAGAIAAAPSRPIQALDLACGTGNYLSVQRASFGAEVVWRGLDASPAMLERAKAKLEGIDLVQGRAEELPYETSTFDFVSCNFAFHHFEDKGRALDEIRRVLKPGGRVRLTNIDPRRMSGWWVYRFFPEAVREDEKRFWSSELLLYELRLRGFEAGARVEVTLGMAPIGTVLADAERRDISQLDIVPELVYQRGLAEIRSLAAREPSTAVEDVLALATIRAGSTPHPS